MFKLIFDAAAPPPLKPIEPNTVVYSKINRDRVLMIGAKHDKLFDFFVVSPGYGQNDRGRSGRQELNSEQWVVFDSAELIVRR